MSIDQQKVTSPVLYFMSDAHLGSYHHHKSDHAQKQLYRFWHSISQPGNVLYILGDLFDFWFEWPEAVPARHFGTLLELRKLVDAGVEVHLLPGNHDFHFGPFMSEKIGLRLHDEPYEFDWGGSRFHVRHGDDLNPDDRGYLFLKSVLRHPLSRALFSLLSPAVGMWLADHVSRLSGGRSSSPAENRFSQLGKYADYQLENGADFVIMGHIHIPRQTGDKGEFVILGDWIKQFSYARYDENGMQLKRVPDDTSS
jgi:UDP-2,3-diacylglucosamine hydrolase